MNKLTIALAKGRLGEEGLRLFENTELEIVREINSRKLVFNNEAGEVSYIFVKPSDVVTYVEKGVADIGIAVSYTHLTLPTKRIV